MTLTGLLAQVGQTGDVHSFVILAVIFALVIGLPTAIGVRMLRLSNTKNPDYENWIESMGLEKFQHLLLIFIAVIWLITLIILLLTILHLTLLLSIFATESSETASDSKGLHGHLPGLFVTILGVIGLLTLPYGLIQRKNKSRKNEILAKDLITRRIDNAVQSLASSLPEAQCSSTEIGARIGAVHALGRIAAESNRHHLRVMDILCDYLRLHTMAAQLVATEPQAPCEGPLRETKVSIDKKTKTEDTSPPSVLQAVITVIGRRSSKQIASEQMPQYLIRPYRIDLRNVGLRGADMAGFNLAQALMDNSQFDHALLNRAKLDETDLRGASLRHALLWKASLCDAQLWTADLTEADLRGADMQRADAGDACMQDANLAGARLAQSNLTNTNLTGADLEGADLQDATLVGAKLYQADLDSANLQGANLENTNLQETNLERVHWVGARNLSHAHLTGAALRNLDASSMGFKQSQLNHVFSDASLSIPKCLQRPGHWPNTVLSDTAFHRERRLWLRDPMSYLPPHHRG